MHTSRTIGGATAADTTEAAAATTGATAARPGARQPWPIVIAHRGACGYLPEHTLAAKAYAHALGADYLEQDVLLTRDDVPVVFHDPELEALTDVASVYPSRRRADGHWYLIDFTLEELRRLEVRERVDPATGAATWPGRGPARGLGLRIPTLAEELTLIRAMDAATGRTTGVYTEVKSPAWQRAQGHDPSPRVLEVLAQHGYASGDAPAFVQCFDARELVRIRVELGSPLKLIQLIGENAWGESDTDYDRLRTPQGLREIARHADGIGPWIAHVAQWPAHGGAPEHSTLVADAHAAGLAVHPYTLRIDQLPPHAPDADAVHHALFAVAGCDGVFTDFTDRTLDWLARHARRPPGGHAAAR